MKPIRTFIIRHKKTKEQWGASSGKNSWKAIGHAKNAWAGSSQPDEFKKITKYSWKENMKFDEQDVYEIVELKPESEEYLQEAITLLQKCTHICEGSGETLYLDIQDFLIKTKDI